MSFSWDMLGALPYMKEGVSRTVTPENPNAAKGGACRTLEGTGARCATHLGQGWKISPSKLIPAGETGLLADIQAQGEITRIWIGGDICRDFILRMYWDGAETAAVECPLSDFFANAWTDNRGAVFSGPFFPLNTLVMCINPNNAMLSFWRMPFEKGFRITLENISRKTLCTYYEIDFTEKRLAETPLYFHAVQRETPRVEPMKTHVILDGVRGKGCYAGTSMAVELHGNENWWGEGEVKFYLDGDDAFPSVTSTGTEDYFLGSFDWEVDGRYMPYSCPYGGMFYVNKPGVKDVEGQRFAMCRWHLPDPILFRRDIRVDIQDLGWEKTGEKYAVRSDRISTVAYFYLDHPGT